MKLHFIIVSLLFFLANCQHPGNSARNGLIVTNEIVQIPIDSSIYYIPGLVQYWYNDTMEVLFYKNHGDQSIVVFDLQSEKERNRINFKLSSEQKFRAKGFHVYTLDSIALTTGYEHKIYFGNYNGKVTSKFDYSKNYEGFLPLNIMSHISQPLILSDSMLYTLNMINVGYERAQEAKDKIDTKVAIATNIFTGSTKFLPMTYPSDYFKSGVVDFIYSRIYNGEYFIYSFQASHDIYVTKDHQNIQKYLAKSEYINKFKEINSAKDYFRHYAEAPIYVTIDYDPYRNIYYRYAYHGTSLTSNDNPHQFMNDYPVFSIIVLDSSFTKVNELNLPKDRFSLFHRFISKDGLYLSENTPWNPDFTEDTLKYRLIRYNYE